MTLLVDTGPLVAIFSPSDSYHASCSATLRTLNGEPMITTWQCFTEAMYFHHRDGGYRQQSQLWNMRRAGLLRIHTTTESEADRLDFLMGQYRNLPLALADASLIAAAESLTLRRLFTIDSRINSIALVDGSFLNIFA